MHLVGFIIRIYHDARSPEHQIFPEISLYDILIGIFLWIDTGYSVLFIVNHESLNLLIP